ncbi:MAG: hypothetical protein JNJ80_10075 [Gemmatimonadetes bacterium]|nr:hypothetical protein [Gemmatimonadota bacterium]
MSRIAGVGRARWRGAALVLACLSAPLGAQPPSAPPSGFQTAQIGQITAVARPADLDLAVALADRADQPADWYGLGRRTLGPLVLVLVRGDADFRLVGRGRVPSWGAGWTMPAARFVVIRADGEDPFRVLRHELAHVILHQAARGRLPLWFDEGYAVLAAGEFGRFERLQLNVTVARGRVPGLGELSNALRADRSTADAAYGLAGSAVAFLAERTPSRSLAPVLDRIARGIPFDSAVLLGTGLNAGRFEEAWQRTIKRRHGLGLWLGAGGMWIGVAVLVILAHYLRRRRDRPRREALDVGWDVSTSDESDPDTTDRA